MKWLKHQTFRGTLLKNIFLSFNTSNQCLITYLNVLHDLCASSAHCTVTGQQNTAVNSFEVKSVSCVGNFYDRYIKYPMKWMTVILIGYSQSFLNMIYDVEICMNGRFIQGDRKAWNKIGKDNVVYYVQKCEFPNFQMLPD